MINFDRFLYLTDTHCDYGNGVSWHEVQQEEIYHKEIFPYMEEHNIDTIFINGDFFDKRSGANTKSIDFINRILISEIIKRNYKLIINTGNHDVYHKTTNSVNALNLFIPKHDNITIIDSPIRINDSIIVPWITSDNHDDIFSFVNANKDAFNVFGHFEFSGFPMQKNGFPMNHGMSANLFKDFRNVYSGHYHTSSEIGNVKYTGSTFQYTKADLNDQKYFYDMDLKNNVITPVAVKYNVFVSYRLNVGEELILSDCSNRHVYLDVSKGVEIDTVKNVKEQISLMNPYVILVNDENSIEFAKDVMDNILQPKSTTELIEEVVENTVWEDINIDKNVFLNKIINLYNLVQ
jgi:hypothetical protein